MKLGPDMYHPNTFHLQQNDGGQSMGGSGAYTKDDQKMP